MNPPFSRHYHNLTLQQEKTPHKPRWYSRWCVDNHASSLLSSREYSRSRVGVGVSCFLPCALSEASHRPIPQNLTLPHQVRPSDHWSAGSRQLDGWRCRTSEPLLNGIVLIIIRLWILQMRKGWRCRPWSLGAHRRHSSHQRYNIILNSPFPKLW